MSTLPDDFLASPVPDIAVTRIDFSQTNLPEYGDLYAVILDNVLSSDECDQLLKAAEATTEGEWERAMINIGGGRQRLMTDARNCGRIIWDSREVVAKVWGRIEKVPEVQEIVRLENVPKIFGNGPGKRGEVWTFTRLNERMRFLKYVGGEYFRPHCDGSYETPDRKERTFFTLHLYLNNAGSQTPAELDKMSPKDRVEAMKQTLTGGATTFHSLSWDEKKSLDVLPKTGRILLFQHRNLLHSGADVLSGVKYTMRTDLLYALESTNSDTKIKIPTLQN